MINTRFTETILGRIHYMEKLSLYGEIYRKCTIGTIPGYLGDDTGEGCISEGYVGLRLLYVPLSPANYIWVDE